MSMAVDLIAVLLFLLMFFLMLILIGYRKKVPDQSEMDGIASSTSEYGETEMRPLSVSSTRDFSGSWQIIQKIFALLLILFISALLYYAIVIL